MKRAAPQIGHRMPRFDAVGKATGAEKYAADHYPENLLWAGVRRAGVPHGRILEIDTSAAEKIPGVQRVLTRADVPGSNRQGIVHKDQPVLCGRRVRHCGDPVALVLAEDLPTLRRAVEAVRVSIEPLPAVFDVRRALQADAPRVHEEGNLLRQAALAVGDAPSELEHCPVVVEGTFNTPVQAHAFLETEGGTARCLADGSIELTVGTQAPFRDRFEVAHALGLQPGQVHVICPYLGGGFGGKDGATVQCLLALAALNASGRPVKMIWPREESFVAGYKRHAAEMHYRLGADADGTLRALDCELYYDTGAYAHLGVEVMALGMEHAGGVYRIPHTRIRGWCVYTNLPIAGAMRAFGVIQPTFAIEGMLDRLAQRIGVDPLKLRLQNALRRGDRNCVGVTLTRSTGMAECLRRLRRHPLWTDRQHWRAAAPTFRRRGVGICAVSNAIGYGRGLADAAVAKVKLTARGHIRVFNGVPDMGQGNASTFVQIAGEILCQPIESMELVQPDTERTHPSGSSAAGRTTYTYGQALIRACEDLKTRLTHRAAMLLLVDRPAELTLLPGRIDHLPSGKSLPLEALAAMLPAGDRTCIGQYTMPVAESAPESGRVFDIGFPHILFSYGAHLVRVEMDELTGEVRVVDYLAVTDAGRRLNPDLFEQQVQGAVAQGLGYALSEEVQTCDGRIVNPDFTTYILPTAVDLPDITCQAVDTLEPSGPYGMKGVGEVAINGPLPAVAAALSDAAGLRLTTAPLTPERVLAAWRQAAGEGGGPA